MDLIIGNKINHFVHRRFQKDMGKSLPAINMKDTNYPTLTQKMIDLCTKLQKEKNLDLETAYQEAFNVIKGERFPNSLANENATSDLASTFKAALQQKAEGKPSIKPNVKDIFIDK